MLLQGDEIFEVSDDGVVTSKGESGDKPDEGDNTGSKETTTNVGNIGEYGDLFTVSTNEDDDDDNNNEDNSDEDGDIQDKDKQKPDSTQGDSSSTLNLQALTSALRDSGYLPNATEEDLKDLDSAERFAELIQKEIQSNEYNDLPDDAAEALKAVRNGASWEDIVAFKKQEVQNQSYTEDDLKGDEDTSVEARKSVLRQYYSRTTSFNDSKIDTLIQRAIDTGTDEKEAIESLKELQELDKTTLAEFNKKQEELAKQKKAEQQNKIKALKESIDKKDEFLPGVKFNEKQKDALYKSIVEPVDKMPNGTPINAFTKAFNSDEEFRMKVHALAVLTKDFTDFSSLETKAKKNALQEFDRKLKKGQIADNDNGTPYERTGNKDSGILDFLNKNY